MKLFFRKYGSGRPLIILHGLFGQSDNWNSLGKLLAEHFEVYLVDQRNHGLSPHSEEWNYKAMADDLLELMKDQHLEKVNLIGHSLGGKTCMQFALEHCIQVAKMIIADMAPRRYEPHHDHVLKGLQSVDLSRVQSRGEADEVLQKFISDEGTRQFLLKNLYRKSDKQLAWRFNLEVIADKISEINASVGEAGRQCGVDSLFMRGEHSSYIKNEDQQLIMNYFPNTRFVTIPDAGHWIHAEKPEEFFAEVMKFLQKVD